MSLMLDEIAEQPAALEQTIRREGRRIERFGARMRERGVRLVVLVARGSSDNAALFGRYLLEVTTGIPVSLAAPSVHTLYGARLDLGGALVVGVSQSGEGDDVNLVLERARRAGATTLAITNERGSSMTEVADETFLLHAGRERSVAATKTYTGQLMVFYLLARGLGWRGRGSDVERVPALAAGALETRAAVEAMVERYAFMEQCVVVGRGLNYANAYEFAIKLMETCYVVAERFSSADFLHGPIAVVERHFPVFMFAPPGPTMKGSRELLAKLASLGAETVVISSERAALRAASRGLALPERAAELLSPIPYIVPAQLFAALLARAKGLDPDRPRSLAKVTKTI
jgi:glucosamine--fructose-6-phosphate aminotransferase (isomerizing)